MKRIQPYSMIACCYLFCNSSLLSIRDVHNYASLQHLSKARFDCPSPHNRSSVTTYFTLRMTARKEEKKNKTSNTPYRSWLGQPATGCAPRRKKAEFPPILRVARPERILSRSAASGNSAENISRALCREDMATNLHCVYCFDVLLSAAGVCLLIAAVASRLRIF